MTTLTIHNPADGSLITQLPADDAASVAAKAQAARAAQPAWARVPLTDKLAMVARAFVLAWWPSWTGWPRP